MKKKKILFLIPSLAGGGAERTLVNFLNQADYSKYDIDLCVVANDGVYFKEIPRSVKITILFNSVLLVRILAYLQKKIGFYGLFKRVISKKIAGEYDVAISFIDSNFTDLLFFIKGAKKRVAWVHTSYSSYNNFSKFYKRESYREKLKKYRYSRLDTIVFVSNDSMNEFKTVFGEFSDMRVVYNVLNVKGVIEKSKAFEVGRSDVLRFVAIGSLIPVKGYETLIRAVSIIINNGKHIQLQIVGGGFLRSELGKLVEELGLQSVVEFIGFVPNPYPYLAASDVFVMSSVSEALPTALCEAMILGKPVVVTNCSGCRELVAEGRYGLMAEPDSQSLADNMTQYADNQSVVDYYTQQSKIKSKEFNDSVILKSYYSIFE